MTFLGVLVIIILIIALFGDRITRWLSRYLQRRFAERIMREFGMPPHQEAAKGGNRSGRTDFTRHRRRGRDERRHIIPPEYAEDVEYVEIQTKTTESKSGYKVDSKEEREWYESQVEDAEYVEIREKR